MRPLSALALTLTALLIPVLGLTPNLTMDAIADFAGGFLHAGTPEHAVHYFSITNLKGAGISLAIGLLVYLFIIRTMLMGRDERGERVYLDVWPAGLDLEDAVYRPVIGLITKIGGAAANVCSEKTLETYIYKPVIGGASFAGLVLAKMVSEMTDMLAVIADDTVLRVRHAVHRLGVGGKVAQTVGGIADSVSEGLNHTIRRERPVEHHYTGTLAGLLDGLSEIMRSTTHTMSFGLVLFGLGLCVTLLYLLLY